MAYARQLYGRDDLAGGTFDTQFTFAQTLTEAVKAVPGAMLVVSIPASSAAPSAEETERGATDIEVGGLNGAEALARLQQVIRRIADQWRPASPVESFAIVRQRLFEEPSARRAGGHRGGRPDVHRLLRRNRAEFPPGSPSRPMRSGSGRRTRSIRSCSTGCTRTGRRWTGSSGPAACCG